MNVKCKYCKSKHRLTKASYDDMEYLGVHRIHCKHCSRTFGAKFNGMQIISVK